MQVIRGFSRLQAEVEALRNELNLSRAQTANMLSTARSREAEIEEDQRRFRQIKTTLQVRLLSCSLAECLNPSSLSGKPREPRFDVGALGALCSRGAGGRARRSTEAE